VDLAVLSLGAIDVPIFTTQAVDQVRFILEDSGARILFVSGGRVLRHARPGFEGLEQLERIVLFDADPGEEVKGGLALETIEESGAELDRKNSSAYDELVSRGTADQLATIIYTSGTTGEPKGVMLSHENFLSDVVSVANGLPISSSDVALSVLPLSHIFERTAFYIFCYGGISVYYATSSDKLGEYLREVRPTVMTAVPRLFETVYHRIVKKGMSSRGWRRKVFMRALEVGRRYAELKDKGRRVPLRLKAEQRVADRLVFAKWREAIGGRLRYFVSGGAPISPKLSYSFIAAGIPLLQGYGMTETCIVSANRPDDNRVGSVGKPFDGIEIAIAEDDEILLRGPNVMHGYYRRPEATREVMREGWFATGDVGYLGEDGRLYITDRKKDLFKLSNGKYIAPQQIESLLKQSPLVNQVVVVGGARKYPAALVVPEWETLKTSLRAAGENVGESHADMANSEAAKKLLQREVTGLTAQLPDYERVRRVALLPEEFSIDKGDLTPTLKVKRGVVDEKYGELIEKLYEQSWSAPAERSGDGALD
jgi:long-chain acyl-CoA synthetase